MPSPLPTTNSRAAAALCLLLAVALALPADAEENWSSAKTLAVGGAGRVISLDNSCITLNPGAITNPYPHYTVDSGYQRFDPLKSNTFHFSTLDSQTSDLAMGIDMNFQWTKPPFDPSVDMAWYDTAEEPVDDRRIDRFTWAMAYGFAMRRFNVGAGLRVYHVEDALRGNETPVSLDVGLSWWISPNVAIGVVGGNVIPTRLAEEPTTLAAGFATSLAGGILWMELDGIIDFHSGDKPLVDTNAGAQITLLQQINIRSGFASDHGFRDKYWSWGLGWTIPNFSVSYSMRVELGEMERRLNLDVPEAGNRLLHAWLISVSF
jgi:hypothetical protein